jgi:hypothetical protein
MKISQNTYFNASKVMTAEIQLNVCENWLETNGLACFRCLIRY